MFRVRYLGPGYSAIKHHISKNVLMLSFKFFSFFHSALVREVPFLSANVFIQDARAVPAASVIPNT